MSEDDDDDAVDRAAATDSTMWEVPVRGEHVARLRRISPSGRITEFSPRLIGGQLELGPGTSTLAPPVRHILDRILIGVRHPPEGDDFVHPEVAGDVVMFDSATLEEDDDAGDAVVGPVAEVALGESAVAEDAAFPERIVTFDSAELEEDDYAGDAVINRAAAAAPPDGPNDAGVEPCGSSGTIDDTATGATQGALLPLEGRTANVGCGWRVCINCGVYERFRYRTDLCCWKRYGTECEFP